MGVLLGFGTHLVRVVGTLLLAVGGLVAVGIEVGHVAAADAGEELGLRQHSVARTA